MTILLRASLVALSVLAAGPVMAQATDEDEATTTVVEGDTDAVETVTTTEDDDGFDLGWLGLLGLAGLAGLRRRPETVITRTTPR